MRSASIRLGVLLLFVLTAACFRGGERDKEAPPGLPGGLCLGPNGTCDEGTCNMERNYCYDAADPCDGFFCGGEERGVCIPTAEGQPECTCELPYTNDQFDLYCCPTPESGIVDMNCMAPGDVTQEEEPSQR